jgi:hypothetical protein
MKCRDNSMDPFKDSKLFNQKGFVKAVKQSEHPSFDIEAVFDHNFKPGNEIALAKKKKKKSTEKLISSFSKTKSGAGNQSYYKYQPI